MVELACAPQPVDEERTGMRITTTRFGEIDVPDDRLVQFQEGLLGFEPIKQYVVLESSPDSPFHWLQAVSDPALAFVVINPFDFFTDYDFEIADADAERLDLHRAEDVITLTIVTIGETDVTTNLLGPIIINSANHQARQLALTDAPYSTRHSLLPPP